MNNKKHNIVKISENSLRAKFLFKKPILKNSIFKLGSNNNIIKIIKIWITNFTLAEIDFLSSNNPREKNAIKPNIKEKYILL